jgi:hypothetical protein
MNLARIPLITSPEEAALRNALGAALLESVLCTEHADDDPEYEGAVELYLRAHWMFLRAHDLPVASCCELGDMLAEIAKNLRLPEADPKAIGLFTRCARCTFERGAHEVEAPHAIPEECEGWQAP